MIKPTGLVVKALVYVHGDKESNREVGERLGLAGEALTNFLYTAYELELEYQIDVETGHGKLIKVDGREFK